MEQLNVCGTANLHAVKCTMEQLNVHRTAEEVTSNYIIIYGANKCTKNSQMYME